MSTKEHLPNEESAQLHSLEDLEHRKQTMNKLMVISLKVSRLLCLFLLNSHIIKKIYF